MSKYSGIINGTFYCFVFKKHKGHKGWYNFYLGQYHICQLVPKTTRKNLDKPSSWSVIVANELPATTPRLVHGFKTRMDAVDYALQVHELTRNTYNSTLRGDV
jgi:ribosomal protein L15